MSQIDLKRLEDHPPEDVAFISYKRGEVNLIVTNDRGFYDRFLLATDLATRFNLLVKADRIALFQAVLYGART